MKSQIAAFLVTSSASAAITSVGSPSVPLIPSVPNVTPNIQNQQIYHLLKMDVSCGRWAEAIRKVESFPSKSFVSRTQYANFISQLQTNIQHQYQVPVITGCNRQPIYRSIPQNPNNSTSWYEYFNKK
ncbi:hypothetical protein [Cylindrospermum sp. FACHB-282]|uniref:hypothetical protein n=1 Tax=Cylindrospermum sp. FACHB-282 TaxID=2692794 RepID=UPI0016879966|nr:hypothetical protein [Cylindrospermum sp. FACHB-282]